MVGEAAKMYHEMSPQTGEFIIFFIHMASDKNALKSAGC